MSNLVEMYIYGPPGTGKTTRIKSYVEEIVKKRDPRDIALTSFTRASAAVLGGRIKNIPHSNIGTLHSFAFRGLGLNKEQVAESKLKEWNIEQGQYQLNAGAALADVEGDSAAVEPVAQLGEADELYNLYNIARARLRPVESLPIRVQVFAKRWEAWKQANNLFDFTDMISLATQNVSRMPGDPLICFADEYQDLAPNLQKLLDTWARNFEMILKVGDADQVLYEFAGVMPDSMVRPDLDDQHKRVLAQSWRVPSAIHSFAFNWIKRVSKREPIEYFPRQGSPGELNFISAVNYNNGAKIVELIEKDLVSYEPEPGKPTVMILASCSYMLDSTLKALREAGIPFSNQYRKARGDWNPLSGGGGTSSAARLLAYLRPVSAVWGEESRMWDNSDLKTWASVMSAKGIFKHGMKTFIENELPPTEKELTINWLLQYFEPSALEKLADLDLDFYLQSIVNSRRKAMEFPIAVAKKRGGLALREAPRVCVGTIHSVKGGEAQSVYLLPDLSRPGYDSWQRGGLARDSILRQFYVGMTRASEKLSILESANQQSVDLWRWRGRLNDK